MCAFWKGGENIWQAILKNLILLSFPSDRETKILQRSKYGFFHFWFCRLESRDLKIILKK